MSIDDSNGNVRDLRIDCLQYTVHDGRAELFITGYRREGHQDIVFKTTTDTFNGILGQLMDYHTECVGRHNAPSLMVHGGVCAESTKSYDASLRLWEVLPMTPRAVLLAPERTLLQGIVNMHNQVYNFAEAFTSLSSKR